MDINDIQNLQEAYNQMYQVDEAKQESDEEDWRKSEIRNLRRHRQTGTRTPYTDRIVSHTKGRGVKKERGSKVQREETQVDEVNMGGKLDKKERLAMTLEGFSREEIDLYDIIFTHLLDEGYAATKEAAVAIMANMSEEWRDSIVESTIVESTPSDVVRDRLASREKYRDTVNQARAAGVRGPVGLLKKQAAQDQEAKFNAYQKKQGESGYYKIKSFTDIPGTFRKK